MNELLSKIWQKVVDHREVVIKVGSTAVMAVVGLVVANVVIKAQEENELIEDIIMRVEDGEDLA